jgi:hypothetical protein
MQPVRGGMTAKRLLLMAAAIVAVGGISVPVAVSGGGDKRTAIGVRLNFTSDTHADGTFAVCCAITDSGVASADVTSFEPRRTDARFEATNAFVGSKGSFTLKLRGVTGPLDSSVHIATGHWHVVGGTGAYENLEGEGRLTATTDQNTGALTGIDTGKLSGAED